MRLPRSTQERLQELRRLKRQARTQKCLSPDALRRVTGWSAASLMALEQAELMMQLRPLENEDCGEPSSLETERPLPYGAVSYTHLTLPTTPYV